MEPRRALNRVEVLLIALLALLIPVVILAFTLGFLITAGELTLRELTALELLELYLIDLVIFVAGSYVLYRLLKHAIEERLPQAIERIDREELNGDRDGYRQSGTSPRERDGHDE